MGLTGGAGPDDALVFNGIDVATGEYLWPPRRVTEFARALEEDAGPVPGARDVRRRQRSDEAHLGVVYGRDPDDLASVGWGVVVPPGLGAEAKEALEPLLRLREEQAGELFRWLEPVPGEDKDTFLARHGMGPGVADPRKVPYYLLLVGDPGQIPFSFQYELGVQYAVGRLDLGTPEELAAYAASVVAADGRPGGHAARARARLHLFGTRHPGDAPTALSSSQLVRPLADELRATGCDVGEDVGDDVGAGATRARLERLLTGPDAPDVLFTAGHGLGGKPPRPAVQGALLCQDWPGPGSPVGEAEYLAGDHLASGTAVGPRVVFSFACFGAGTPATGDDPVVPEPATGTTAFTARLPRRLLGRPGGALAFVGHVDRAWSCSFLWRGLPAQVTPFLSTLLALGDGARIGVAMESLTSRYAELAVELMSRQEALRTRGIGIDDDELVGLWTAARDARAHVVLGDPAVRAAGRGTARATGQQPGIEP